VFDFYLKVFISVAKMNSFTRAAEFLNLSQPAVTHQIKNLENRFKTKLFNRDQNKIYLTKSGQVLLKYAENIDLLYQKAMQEILKINNQVVGDIHLGAVSLLGNTFCQGFLGVLKRPTLM
jgi:DNA-binding transcriptional LysR family regulator